MFLLSGPDHGRISAMPHKGFLEKQQERPVVSKGQYVPAARRQSGGTNEKRRHTSKAAVRTQTRQQCTGKAAAHRQGGGTNEKRRHTSKAAVRTQTRQQRTGEAAATGKTKAAVSRRAARNSGGSDCPCAQPSGFVLRCSARGSPVRAVPFGRFGKGAPPGYALSVCAARHVCRTAACGISFPCLQLSARIFSSSSCR